MMYLAVLEDRVLTIAESPDENYASAQAERLHRNGPRMERGP